MKSKIAAGDVALGVSLMFPSPQLVEMIAYAGFDWVLLDCEHGSLSLADVEVMTMAADAAGITAIARPKTNASADIQSVLDRGVKGVQIPHVSSRTEAERVVSAVKFGPRSDRGLAAGTRPDRWGLGAKMADFTAQANAQSLVCIQIEDAVGVAAVDEIVTVPGIDVVFVGQSDLSQSLGFPGDPKAPPVAAAIARVLAAALAAGKAPGLPVTTDTLPAALASGCRYVYTHLPRLLGAGARDFLAAGRR